MRIFKRFQEQHRASVANQKLTPIGVREADAQFAAKNLPALRERLANVRETAARTESEMLAKLRANLITLATDPAEIALMQETRTWLRSLPKMERLTKARKLASQGDITVLRSILTAPAYLAGLDSGPDGELLTAIQDEAIQREHPERHAKLESFRTAAKVAERALEGVVGFVEQQTAIGPPPPVVDARPAVRHQASTPI